METTKTIPPGLEPRPDSRVASAMLLERLDTIRHTCKSMSEMSGLQWWPKREIEECAAIARALGSEMSWQEKWVLTSDPWLAYAIWEEAYRKAHPELDDADTIDLTHHYAKDPETIRLSEASGRIYFAKNPQGDTQEVQS